MRISDEANPVQPRIRLRDIHEVVEIDVLLLNSLDEALHLVANYRVGLFVWAPDFVNARPAS